MRINADQCGSISTIRSSSETFAFIISVSSQPIFVCTCWDEIGWKRKVCRKSPTCLSEPLFFDGENDLARKLARASSATQQWSWNTDLFWSKWFQCKWLRSFAMFPEHSGPECSCAFCCTSCSSCPHVRAELGPCRVKEIAFSELTTCRCKAKPGHRVCHMPLGPLDCLYLSLSWSEPTLNDENTWSLWNKPAKEGRHPTHKPFASFAV